MNFVKKREALKGSARKKSTILNYHSFIVNIVNNLPAAIVHKIFETNSSFHVK